MARNYETRKIQKDKKLRKYLFLDVNGICPLCKRDMIFESIGIRVPNPYDFTGDKTKYSSSSNSRVFSVDHIVPISKGGGNDIKNLRGICLTCNKKKKDK